MLAGTARPGPRKYRVFAFCHVPLQVLDDSTGGGDRGVNVRQRTDNNWLPSGVVWVDLAAPAPRAQPELAGAGLTLGAAKKFASLAAQECW